VAGLHEGSTASTNRPAPPYLLKGSTAAPPRRPVGGADYPRSQQEFDDWFPDEAACIEYLAQLRWPTGFVCPTCGDDRSWHTGTLSRICVACGRRTSATSGTIFHRSHAPISTWLAAIWFVTAGRNGVSARDLQRAVGLGSYETAWAWLQKLRRAMVDPEPGQLVGTVELDETPVDGHGSTTVQRAAVLVAVERLGPHRLGHVRLELAERAHDVGRLLEFARRTVVPNATIHVHADAPGARRVAADLGRWFAGTLHHRVSREHLPYYLHEYAFRFERRTPTGRGLLFYELLRRAVATDPHPLAQLVRRHTP
jgi:hypothetical protein